MKISELIFEVGLPAPTGQTLGQKYAGVLDPNSPYANEKSRIISTNPKEIAAAKAARDAQVAAKLSSYGSKGTQQQQAQQTPAPKGPLASKDTSNATDVEIKVPGQAAATVQPTTQKPPIQKPQTPKKPMGGAPTLGAPVAAQTAGKPGGFFSGVAQGFKKGMGMDPDQGIAANLAQSGLDKLGMKNAAAAAGGGVNPQAYINQVLSSQPKVGQSIRDPISGRGNVKVMPNPGGKGVKLDTTKTLGYPIIVDPKDIT
jgi:hypothetical protein